MRRLFKWLGIVTVVTVMASGLLGVGARYHDGPLSIFVGGPFKSGDAVPAPSDWTLLRDRDTVEFQTLDPPISRTIWFVVHDGLPGLIAKWSKRWPYQLENDNRIILRIDDTLYEQQLQRVTSGPDIVPVLDAFGRKYGDDMGIGAAEITEGYTRMYEVVDR